MLVEYLQVLVQSTAALLINPVILKLILFLSLILVVYRLLRPVIKLYKNAKKLEEIATNPKPHWFYGHTKFFGTDPDQRTTNIAKISKYHPTMFNFWRGPVMSSLQLFHPDMIQQLIASGAPKDSFGYGLLRPWLGDGLLTSGGEKWKRHRMLLTPAFHFNILKPYMQVSNQTVRVLIEKWKTKNNGPLEISNDISLMTLDTMVQCAMSTKTDCQSTEGQHPYVQTVCEVARSLAWRFRKPHYLIDWIFKMTKDGKTFYNGIEKLHQHAEKIISDRKRVLSDDGSKMKKDKRSMLDFLDILIQAKDEEGKGMTDQEIRDEVDTFLFEGHDTTSSGISWALYNLAKYPEFQEKCREEVQSICRDQDDIEWDDLSRMTYLTMFIKESLRLYPPVVGFGRQLEKPLKLRSNLNKEPEVEVPAGSILVGHVMALQRNPIVWKNPDEFDPERFNKENSSGRNPYSFLPFSVGARNCIGQNFAMNEMKVCLSQILRNFRLYLDEETPTPKMEFRIILQSEKGIHIKLQSLETE